MNEVRNILIGFELGSENAQICYFDRAQKEPVSAELRVGESLLEFPVMLLKRKGTEEWYAGPEAVQLLEDEEWLPAADLLQTAQNNDTQEIDGQTYSAKELLALFFRESLKVLGIADLLRGIRGICVTTEKLTDTLAFQIRGALMLLGFPAASCLVQDYEESFYYYGYCQRPDVSVRNMALIRFAGNEVSFQTMRELRVRKPFTVTISEPKSITLPEEAEERDQRFAAAIEAWTERGNYSGMMITGNGFSPSWARRSIKMMSRGGAKVFEGGNLFVKGACWAAYEKLENHAFRGRIYLGPNLIQTTVGIDIIRGTTQKFFPLIKPGINWFENAAEVELIPEQRKDLLVTVVSMDGTKHRNERLLLEGLPDRPDRATRLLVRAYCTSMQDCMIEVEDLGFGEFFEATHQVWRLQLPLHFDEELERKD
ncbi:MAG: DUF5716 family protein [Lachnospiraceae bacterium]|nr:DUF5716 family protein [Lachnospiraceae bacterium]